MHYYAFIFGAIYLVILIIIHIMMKRVLNGHHNSLFNKLIIRWHGIKVMEVEGSSEKRTIYFYIEDNIHLSKKYIDHIENQMATIILKTIPTQVFLMLTILGTSFTAFIGI